MGQTWYATVWTVGAAVVFLGAMALLWWGLFGDRSKGRTRCPKCWYDMRGSVAAERLACPECGYEARRERQLRKSRRRWLPIVIALILLLPYGYAGWIVGGWWREKGKFEQLIERNIVDEVHWGVVSQPFPWILRPSGWLLDRLPRGWSRAFKRVTGVRLSRPSAKDIRLLSRFEHLHLVGIRGTTDTGLEHLTDLSCLGILELHGDVTDAAVVHLKELKHLRWLNVSGTSITEAGVNELKQALPWTVIDFRDMPQPVDLPHGSTP